MQEDDEDDIEKLFQNAVRRADRGIDFKESDWNSLETRLNAEAARASRIRVKRRRLALAVTLATVLFYCPSYLLNVREEKPETTTFLSHEGTPQNKLFWRDPLERKKEQLKDNLTKELKRYRYHGKRSYPGNRDTGNSTENGLFQLGAVSAKLVNDKVEKNSILSISGEKLFKDLIEVKAVPRVIGYRPPPIELHEIVAHNQTKPSFTSKVATDSFPKIKFTASRVSLALSIAPDFSGTTSGKFTSPGSAFGLLIHYRFNKRLSFSTGVTSSRKKYVGSGSEYRPPSGYWKYKTNGVVPKSIDGSCYVVEVPVILRYKIRSMRKSSLVIASGASSYFLLAESYRYRFEQPNPGAKSEWSTTKNSSFIFNVINFSLGYEYTVLPQLTVGVEPYIKVPIKDMGWAKVRLYSTGAAFTLRYNVLKKS